MIKTTKKSFISSALVKAAMTLSAVVFCLFVFSSSASAQRWHYALLQGPSSYPLRWGEKEPPSEDMVAMPPGLDTRRERPTSPGCFKVGTGGFSLAYKVEDFVEYGTLVIVIWGKDMYWQKTYEKVPKEGQVELEGFTLPTSHRQCKF